MADALVVASKVKEYIKAKGCQTSAQVIDALSKKIEADLTKAIERTKANGRVTVKASDI